MKNFTFIIAAFIATFAVAQDAKSDWQSCKATSDCSKNWSCANMLGGGQICVNNTLYPDALKDGDCSVPGDAQGNNAYSTYTCPYYFNSSSPSGNWKQCLVESQCNAGWSCASMTDYGGALCVNTTQFAGQTSCSVPGGQGINIEYQYNTITCPGAPKASKASLKNWNNCNTTADCNAGWSCANTVTDQTICVNNTLYAINSTSYKNNKCSVPGTAPQAVSYFGYTCPPYGGANATTPATPATTATATTPATPAIPASPATPAAPGHSPSNFPRILDCDVKRTCKQVIHHATGKNINDAKCYEFELFTDPQTQTHRTHLKHAGMPIGKKSAFKCLTDSQLNSGMNGVFKSSGNQWSIGDYQYNFYVSSQSQVVRQNGQVMSNFFMQTSRGPKGQGRMQVIRQNIMDYFHYAIIQGTSLNSTYTGTCDNTCGKGQFAKACCAEMSMMSMNWDNNQNREVEAKDVVFVCMNQSVAAADLTMNIAGAQVSLKCQENTMSGAMRLVSTTAIAFLAYVSI